MCIEFAKLGMKKIVLPKENAKEASIVKEIEIIPVSNLKETVDFLNHEISINFERENSNNLIQNHIKNYLDFSEVKGQKNIKRAIEVATSGSHNLLMIGNPRFRKNYDCKKNSNYNA